MRKENLLIELGTEELPPKALKTLATSFAENIHAGLTNAELSFEAIEWFAAPRRLAVLVKKLDATQQDKTVEKRGPAVSAAFDEKGEPTKAALGWARGNGIEISDAERLVTEKGEWLLYKAHQAGQSINALLEGILTQALSKLPIPKPMRWGHHTTQFIRPVHTLCVLFGSEVIEAKALGLSSDNKVNGHRFHGEQGVTVAHADEYLATLEKQHVIADFKQRTLLVRQELEKNAAQLGLKPDFDELLLEEIASLVEWPVVLTASFDTSFLQVPKEALIYTMKDDQKYVPLLHEDGELSNQFLFVSNIQSRDPIQVISGNEKVIRPRLADAEFFFNSDKKHSLASRLNSLDSVLFQKQLGTLKDKSQRIATLSSYIAQQINADAALAYRAGELAKADLMTNMVMEFPDVQGVMGKYYALHDGESEEVANALYDQYLPRFAGDDLPAHPVSASVALADKIDTLVGIFGIGQLPKGDKDPFALRRAAIGLLRIISELKLPLDLEDLVGKAIEIYAEKITNEDCHQQVVDFVLGRFNALLQDQGISIDVIQAVSARRPTQPTDFVARIQAVSTFKALDAAEALAAANKRVANILAKQHVETGVKVESALLTESAEQTLYHELESARTELNMAIEQQDYTTVLTRLAQLRESIDAFFDNVMVMTDDNAVRDNRLALLLMLRELFMVTADISLLAKN
ncbi:glycine--tRNA ligase subunit beta [Alteromonas ponticola]|uniref:Glycine--tRNA ligase beta subunit n=1 Tax=Alteromonas aquimaris TaxID=2998417 RepID=A0ABT3P7Z3_9ALTE|nr:glycine--tRNA ligase subunit beta [Alteromonas aquimaris]MCW8108860.1 glycine--tRNA ligase subunit beta [Alteromonas aquimaris]